MHLILATSGIEPLPHAADGTSALPVTISRISVVKQQNVTTRPDDYMSGRFGFLLAKIIIIVSNK